MTNYLHMTHFRLHRSTSYLDAACCYRQSSVVCLPVSVSVGRSVVIVSPANLAELIETPFGMWTQLCPRNHALDWGPDPMGMGNFKGKMGGRCEIQRLSAVSCAKKRLNWSRCCLGFGLWWAQGRMYLGGGVHWRHLTNTIEPSICGGNAAKVWPLILYGSAIFAWHPGTSAIFVLSDPVTVCVMLHRRGTCYWVRWAHFLIGLPTAQMLPLPRMCSAVLFNLQTENDEWTIVWFEDDFYVVLLLRLCWQSNVVWISQCYRTSYFIQSQINPCSIIPCHGSPRCQLLILRDIMFTIYLVNWVECIHE